VGADACRQSRDITPQRLYKFIANLSNIRAPARLLINPFGGFQSSFFAPLSPSITLSPFKSKLKTYLALPIYLSSCKVADNMCINVCIISFYTLGIKDSEGFGKNIIIILVPQASPIPRARDEKLMKKIKV